MRDRRALLAIALATALRLALAPLRILSPDEAYYLAAARTGVTIPDHPPLLGWLLAIADRMPGPIELRARSIAVICSALVALGVIALAETIAEERALPFDPLHAAILASFGLMGFAGGIIVTPDAPMLAAVIWMFVVASRGRSPILLALLASVAVAAKVSALLPVIAIALFVRDWRASLGLAIGAAAALPFALRSLGLQLGHAIGHGALVSAPYVGPLAALSAWVGATFLLFSPPVFLRAARARALFASVPGARLAVIGFALLIAISALVSGRPPEPNWSAPAMLVVIAIAACGSISRVELALHVLPTVAAIGLFLAPDGRLEPLVRMPHRREHTDRAILPGYAAPAWRCVYDDRCGDFLAMSKR